MFFGSFIEMLCILNNPIHFFFLFRTFLFLFYRYIASCIVTYTGYAICKVSFIFRIFRIFRIYWASLVSIGEDKKMANVWLWFLFVAIQIMENKNHAYLIFLQLQVLVLSGLSFFGLNIFCFTFYFCHGWTL